MRLIDPPTTFLPPPPRATVMPSPDQVRAIRIGALELLLSIEMAGVCIEAAFLTALRKLAENPIGEEMRRITEAAR